MLSWESLLANALLWGLALSLVLFVIMAASMVLAPDMWVGDYPPDIREKYGPMRPRSARLRPFVAVAFFAAVLALPLLALLTLFSAVGRLSFVTALLSTFVVLLVFNTFDLLVLDWLLFCTLRPRFLVLPGTEGMAGYRDYRFHFVGFLKGLGFCLVGAVVIAGLWMVGQAVFLR